MVQSELIRHLREAQPNLQKLGVSHLALFGSRARGDHNADSDLDIMLDVQNGVPFTILNLVEIERFVSEKISLTTNAFMRRSLEKQFKDAVLTDVVEIF